MKKLCEFLFVLFVFLAFGQTAWAQNQTIDLSTVDESIMVADGTTLTGILGTNVQISIADGATVTLDNISIDGESIYGFNMPGLLCHGDATLILAEGTTNTVKVFDRIYDNIYDFPAIYVPQNKTLTIRGTGTLNAISTGMGCGIGGGFEGFQHSGNIVIEGGIINATGGYGCAGIGCSFADYDNSSSSCGNITIIGGTVNAQGGYGAAGIGGGYLDYADSSSCGDITITTGVTSVTAIKGEDAPYSIGLGAGSDSYVTCGTINIGGMVGEISISPFTTYSIPVHFDANGGSGNMDDIIALYKIGPTVPACNFTNQNGPFVEWNTEANGTGIALTAGQSLSFLDVTQGSTVTLYAQWMPVSDYFATTGSGTEADPYKIRTKYELDHLAALVNGGNGFDHKYFLLMNDIAYDPNQTENFTAIGNEDNPFRGHFDGDNHTISGVRIFKNGTTNNDKYQGLFGNLGLWPSEESEIKNLILDDADIIGFDYTGGFVGYMKYGYVTNCQTTSSVFIRTVNDGTFHHGGVVGYLWNGEVSNCVSMSTLTMASNLSGCNSYGGLVGTQFNGTLRDNLVIEASVPATTAVSAHYGAIVGDLDNTSSILSNNYYGGCKVNSENITPTGVGCSIESNVLTDLTDNDGAMPVFFVGKIDGFIDSGDAVFAGNLGNYYKSGTQVTLSVENPAPGYGYSFTVNGSPISGNSFNITANVTSITETSSVIDWATAYAGSESDPYLIGNLTQWTLLCTRVNNGTSTYSGKFFKLIDDFTITEEISSGTPATMIGVSESKSFQGTFDGNGHKLTVNYNDTRDADYCGPFRIVKDATIKRLHVGGLIFKYNRKHVGVVGQSFGTTNIISCHSSIDIRVDEDAEHHDASHGGFVGDLRGGTCNITDCLFDGKMQGRNEGAYGYAYLKYWGGFIGWAADGTTANLTNCMFAPQIYVVYILTGSNTFVRYDEDATVSINNCYHHYPEPDFFIDDGQGSPVGDMNNEELRDALGSGWEIKDNKVVPIIAIHPLTGEGSAESPYLISSTDDWNDFACNVFLGETYSGKYFKMTEDISVTRMVGANSSGSYKTFNGIFDGDGHTLTVTLSSDADWCAPFAYTYGATIQNLATEGTITTSARYAGGVVGRNGTGNLIMTNVTSSVAITSTYSGNAFHGGLVGYTINATLTGCSFTGKLLGSSSAYCGGLMGWKTSTGGSSADFYDCFFAPTQVTVSTTGSKTFVVNNGTANFTNCYYTETLGEAQAKQARTITAGLGVTLENAGTVTEHEVSGITSYGVGIKFNEVLYAGQSDNVSLNLDYTAGQGYTLGGYTPSAGTIAGNTNPYTLTMPDENVIISANLVADEWDGDGSEEHPYLIYNSAQLDLLSTRVNGENSNNYNDKYYKLMADIEYDANVADNFTAIGTTIQNQFSHEFNGHFDGQNHTISGINSYDSWVYYNGLFGHLGSGAEVKNVVIDNTTIGDGERSGGIAGINEGTITNCHVTSDVTIKGDAQSSFYHGGIAGYNQGTVSQCSFAGTLTKTFTDPDNSGFTAYCYGGITGFNSETANLSDNLVIGATIPRTMHMYGSVAGYNGGNLARNYYVGCTVDGTANAIGVGCFNSDFILCDITDNDGAVPGYFLTLGENITSDALALVIPAHGVTDEVTYNVSASGNTITLGYELPVSEITYYVDGEPISGNTFTMPDTNVTISATAIIAEPCGKILVDAQHPTWSEDFEDDAAGNTTPYTGILPVCWTVPVEYTSDINDVTPPQVYYKPEFNATEGGSYSLRMRFRSMLAMPELDENVDFEHVQMSLYVRQSFWSYKLEIGVVTDIDNPDSTYTMVATVNNPDKNVDYFECNFSSVKDLTGSGRYIVFKNVGGSEGDLYSNNYLDDITLTYIDVDELECLINPYPDYEETFEAYAVGTEPDCWEVITEDVALESGTRPQVYSGFNTTANGNQSLRLKNRCVYAMPEFQSGYNVSDYTMTFQLRQPKSIYRLQVGVVDAQGEFTLVKTLKCNGAEFEEKTVNFSGYEGRIAFRNTLVPGTGMRTDYLDYSINYIDDINIIATEDAKVDANEDNLDADDVLENIAVYPNPTTDYVNVECTMNNVQSVEVIDVYGKVVRTDVETLRATSLPTRINVSGLAAGMYFVRVTTDRGAVTKPFVKR